jgi:hypothetical protein
VTSTETRATADLRYFLTVMWPWGLSTGHDSYDVSDSRSRRIVSGVAQPAVEEGQSASHALLLNYFYQPFKATLLGSG